MWARSIRPAAEALANDQALGGASGEHRLEETPEQVAVVEAAVPVFGEGGVVRHAAVEAEAAEPAIGEVQVDLVAEPPLRSDAEAVARDQHPDHQLRIDRRPAGLAVVRGQLSPKSGKIDEAAHGPEQVVGWDMASSEKL